MISFADQKQTEWPVVIITNPKDAAYLSSNEPFERIELSSHIRILAFSTHDIEHIRVEIDGEEIFDEIIGPIERQNSPLFAVPWNAAQYTKGLHTLLVSVTDSNQQRSIKEQKFSLDGTISPFDTYSQYILTGPVQQVLVWGFVIADIFIIAFLVSFAWITPIPKESQSLFVSFLSWYQSRCYELRQNTLVYSILLLTWVSMPFAPWFMGKLSGPNHFGCIFLWGIVHFYENGPQNFVVDYFHSMDTHLYAGFQMFNYISSFAYFWAFSGLNSSRFLASLSRRKRSLLVLFIYLCSIYQIFNSSFTMYKIASIFHWYSLLLSPLVAWYHSFVILYILYFVVTIIIRAISPATNNSKENKEK